MTKNELDISYCRLKSSQKLEILREIEASYDEVVSDLEIAYDAMLSNITNERRSYAWDDFVSCDLGHRIAS